MTSGLVLPLSAPVDQHADRVRRALASLPNTQRVLAAAAAFLLGLRFVVHAGVAVGDVLALALIPLWVPNLVRYSGARIFAIVGLATAVWGWMLGSSAIADGYSIDTSDRLQTTAQLVGVVTGVGVLLWARGRLSIPAIGAWFGLGMLANAVIYPVVSVNAWKFTWGAPVSVLVIGLAALSRRTYVGVLALAMLAVVSAVFDCRSYSAALLLAAVLLLGSAGRQRGRPPPWFVVTGFVIALAAATYYLGTALLVSGYLGQHEQARTIAQLRVSGSVILGGRPEIAATWALMQHRISGYGAGVVPNGHDVQIAKQGLVGIGYQPDNGYVEKYMFGGHIELHSMFGDLWAAFGLAGLALVVLVVYLILRGLSLQLAARTGNCLTMFVVVWTLWNVGFSPFLSSMAFLTLGTALALPYRRLRSSVGRSPRLVDESEAGHSDDLDLGQRRNRGSR